MTIHFPDLSHFEAGVPLAGVPALLTKATQGLGYTDPTYATYKAAAHAAGIPFGGYHYVTLDDPQAQARHAFSVLGSTPTMWDVEKWSGTLAHLLAVHDAFVKLGGRAVFAYIPHWYWEQIGRPDLRPLLARGLLLISSQYTSYSDTGPGWAPYGGVTPTIWQYTDAGPVNGRHVDMNAFRGTATELARLFTPSSHPDQGVDMTTVDLTPAAIAAVRDAILAAPIFVRPAGEQTTDGLSLAWAARGAYIRAGQVANVDDPAGAAAIAAIQQAVAGLPAAVAAAVAALPGAAPGAELTAADVETAVAEVLGRTSAGFIVAPPAD